MAKIGKKAESIGHRAEGLSGDRFYFFLNKKSFVQVSRLECNICSSPDERAIFSVDPDPHKLIT